MRALAFKARVLFATRFAEMAEYRAEVVIWMLSGTLSLVMMLVWMAQAAAAPGGQIRGYSAPEFATYFLSTWLVSQLLVVWVSHELDFQIRQGNWKYLDHAGSGGNDYGKDPLRKYALPELEPDAPGQLYDLAADPGETTNLYVRNAAKRRELQDVLARLKREGRSAPRGRTPLPR